MKIRAQMAEPADALVSGTSALTGLWVRIPLWAQLIIIFQLVVL